MWKDLHYCFRTLRRSPVFVTVAVLSLALGIGANTAIFSLLDQVVLRSLPVRDPESLTVLHREYNPSGHSMGDNHESSFSYPMYRDLRDRDPAFAGIVARMGAPVRLIDRGTASAATAEIVSGNFFAVMGIDAAAGRVLAPEDDALPGAHPSPSSAIVFGKATSPQAPPCSIRPSSSTAIPSSSWELPKRASRA